MGTDSNGVQWIDLLIHKIERARANEAMAKSSNIAAEREYCKNAALRFYNEATAMMVTMISVLRP